MNPQPNSSRGLAYSLAATVMFATSLVCAKHGLEGFNPHTFSIVSTVTAASCAFLFIIFTRNYRILVIRTRTSRLRLLLLGLTTGAGTIIVWTAMKSMDPSFTAFLLKFVGVFAAIAGALLLHEKLRAVEIMAFVIMIVGAGVSLVGRWHVVGTGPILVFAACVLGCAQMLIGKLETHTVSVPALAFYRMAIAAVVVLLWALRTDNIDFHVPTRYWCSAALSALIGPCTGAILTYHSYRYWHLARSSMVQTAIPLFVLPLAYLFLDQLPASRELIGGAVILTGAFWLAWIHLSRAKSP